MRAWFLILTISLPGSGAWSQDGALAFGYYGESIFHPGASINYEIRFGFAERAEFIIAPAVRGYVHPRNNFGLMAIARFAVRYTLLSGIAVEANLGTGAMLKTTNGGPVYAYDTNGQISMRDSASRLVWIVEASLGLGFASARGGGFILRPGLFWEYPFNSYFLPHISAELCWMPGPISSQGDAR